MASPQASHSHMMGLYRRISTQWTEFLKVIVQCIKSLNEPTIVDCGVSLGKILVVPMSRVYLIEGPSDLEIKPPMKEAIKNVAEIPDCYYNTGIIPEEALKKVKDVTTIKAPLAQGFYGNNFDFKSQNAPCNIFKTVKLLLKKKQDMVLELRLG